jgi:hypothetical protein
MRQGEIKVPDAQAEAGDLSSPMSVGPLNDARTHMLCDWQVIASRSHYRMIPTI